MNLSKKIVLFFNGVSIPSHDPVEELNVTIQNGQTKKALNLIKGLKNIDSLCGMNKSTPLKCAIKERNLEILRALLEAGASPNLSVDMKPLERALIREFFDGATLLLEKGASFHDPAINTKDNMFSKALLIISSGLGDKKLYAEEKCLKLIQTFVDKGANTNEINAYGDTPLMIIAQGKRKEEFLIKLTDILIKGGAVVDDKVIEIADVRASHNLLKHLETALEQKEKKHCPKFAIK